MLKKIFLSFVVLIILVIITCCAAFYYYVVLHPGEELAAENIQSILGKESPVLYSDGITPLGVFFDDAHRQYVTWDQIPQTFVNALVASEDNRFFKHYGFDAVSIVRAAMENYKAGRVVQGGSTLTQQTAKNLFKRSGRSYEAKLKELLYALRLEQHYSKEQILEFYSNQFYVRGNGHGLGVAARYYFDKDVEELSLLESIFIAGSVKRPNYYNPFNRTSEKAKSEVRERIKIRMAYVLQQMNRLGLVSGIEYEKAKNAEIIFTEGQVGYALDYVMEMVKEAVASKEVQDALEENGISNLATAGLRVITSVNKGLQENTLYALRRELSRLDVRLRGYDRDEVQEEIRKINYRGDQEVKIGSFVFGEIVDISLSGKKKNTVQFRVKLDGELGEGFIDKKGLDRMLTAFAKWNGNRWSEVTRKDFPLLTKQLKQGDRVWVSVNTIDENGKIVLDLERFPLVQGGAIVMQNGMVRAMAGGVENRFFNRAVAAKRTMGSAFKPYIFAAALQLGWNSADLLTNSRNVFDFQGQAYFPRPDHKITTEKVSMSWAGVRSENLASVWLLYHLTDHLSVGEFKEVVEHVGLAPRFRDGKEEPSTLYRKRIRDTYGIVVNRQMLNEAAFNLAVQNLETDFIFEDLIAEYSNLQNLQYGKHFDQYRNDIDTALDDNKIKDSQRKELHLRKNLLNTSYLALILRQQQFFNYRDSLSHIVTDSFDIGNSESDTALYYDNVSQRYVFLATDNRRKEISLVDTSRLKKYLASESTDSRNQFWEKILLDGILTSRAFSLVQDQVKLESQRLSAHSPYSLDVLSGVRDFRVLVGLKYLIAYGQEMGISSHLAPVLSFPLGSNVVTLLEMVRMYESLVTGSAYLIAADTPLNRDLLTIIDRIETIEGDVLYRTKVKKTELLAPEPRLALNHIMENTVTFGTGRYAKKHARLPVQEGENGKDSDASNLEIPLFGKTGTANNYTNASFFGYLPGISTGGTGMVADNGYAVGVYVGFDNNKTMRRKSTRITGSSGALPAWTQIVNTILRQDSYVKKLDPVDLSFYGLGLLHDEIGQVNLAVVKENGGQLKNPLIEVDERNRSQPSIMTFGIISKNGKFRMKRSYKPFWGDRDAFSEADL